MSRKLSNHKLFQYILLFVALQCLCGGTTVLGQSSKTVTFSNDLQVSHSTTFKMMEDEFALDFPYPRRWEKAPGSSLLLNITHSPGLLAKLSHMTIELNGTPLETLSLDESNVGPTDIRVPLDSAPLKDFNHLVIKVVQHYATECEDPFSTVLWTKLSPLSRFEFKYKDLTPTLNLQNWPYPVLDLRNLGRNQVTFAVPQSASVESLRASLALAETLGALADYRALDLSRQIQPNCPTIVIGTPAENSLIASLADDLPLPLVDGKFVDFEHKPISAETGVLELIGPKQDVHDVVLLVTGNTPAAVEKAAYALISREFEPIPGGNAALVDKLTAGKSHPQPEPDKIPGVLPPSTDFTLADLGYNTRTVHGTNPAPIEIETTTFPGVQYIGHRQSMRVVFGVGAQVNPDLSSFEVKLNGVSLRSYALANTGGEEHHEDLLEIPTTLLRANNKFEFAFHLYPRLIGKCEPLIDQQLWATLYDTTQLTINHEDVLTIPDLSLLQESGFPLTNSTTLSDVAFVLPAQSKPTDFLQALRMAAFLGKGTKTTVTDIKACYDDVLPEQYKKDCNLLVFNSGSGNKTLNELSEFLTLKNPGKLLKSFKSSTGEELDISELEPNGFLEEIASPWSRGKVILVAQGNSPSALGLAIDLVTNSTLCYQLKGSLASLSPELIVKTTRSTPTITINPISLWRQLAIWLSDNPWIAPIVISLIIVFLVWRLIKFLRQGRPSPTAGSK